MTRQPSFARPLPASLVLAFLLASAGLAQAASTDIADVPMAVKSSAAPNIMFIQDDSGSMQWEMLPDEVTFFAYLYPRPDGLYGGTDYTNALPNYESGNAYNAFSRSIKNNKAYYNPAITYRPWVDSTGASWPAASPTAAYHNPALPGLGTRNLTANNTEEAWWWKGSEWKFESHTFYPAVYFRYNSGSVWSTGSYTRIKIKSSTPTYTSDGRESRTDCASASTATCTYAEEIQNFANWYTYHRSRILASRGGIGRAFSQLGEEPRIGFSAINQGSTSIDGATSPGAVVSGVRKFAGSDRAAFFDTLYGRAVPAAATPLRRALDDVGKYFERTDNKGPWSKTPGTEDTTAQAACRQNYSILMTDGYWNGAAASTAAARANVDGTDAAAITGPALQKDDGSDYCQAPATLAGSTCSYTYTAAAPSSDGWDNTLADISMYYWGRDLRPDLDNIVRPNIIDPAKTAEPSNSLDPAFWQHMVTYTVGLGVVGSVDPATCPPPYSAAGCASISWPQPTDGATSPNMDDMFHAAINGRGGFFSASDPDVFAASLSAALTDIIGRTGAAAAGAVANAHVTVGENQSFESSYKSGDWTGDLVSFPIDPATGVQDTASPLWASPAQAQLDARTADSRFLISFSGTAPWNGTTLGNQGIQFQPTGAATATKLSAAQQALLDTATSPPGPADGANVLAWLRGDRSKEGSDYRARSHVLGDIINAEPVIVDRPRANFTDPCYGSSDLALGCATSYKSAQAARDRVVLQGANDGMLHAFDFATGAEKWAYVPNLVMGSLNALSHKVGFQHQYFVDATGISRDADFCKARVSAAASAWCAGSDWRTIFVSGLGKGGRGYFALDVTAPVAASEAAAAAKSLWEFPHSGTPAADSKNAGYSFGAPIVAKTRAFGWVVLIASGYNNGADTGGDGLGHLYVLSPISGEILAQLATTAGSSGTPSGLAYLTAFALSGSVDATIEQVYGGDLLGNVWRFDLSSADSATWTVRKLAALVDGSGTAQPVTTRPQLATVTTSAGIKRFIFVGTGRYLGDSDVATTGTQTMYGLIDDLGDAPEITPLRSNLQQQILGAGDTAEERKITSPAVPDYSVKKGWYIDLPATGERIDTHPALALEVLAFTSNIPSSDPCKPGGSSWFNVVDATTGAVPAYGGITWESKFLGEALASRPVLIQLPSGEIKAIIRKSDVTTTVKTVVPAGSGAGGRRISWREIITQ